MDTPMITLEHIVKSFSSREAAVHAVRDVSLTIERGSIYGIVGFSGAGKSTLVRCINLLERPTSGRVFVDGTELTALHGRALSEQRKKIGMIFQQFNLFADGRVMTVGSRNVKDASGLSLKSLFIGSEGTLCVITKCLLRLVPRPETSLSALVPFAVLQDGISSVLAVIKANASPTAIEFVERSVVELGERFTGFSFPCPQASAYILLTFDGTADQVAQSVERVRGVVRDCGALDFIPLTDPVYAADIWRVRGCLVKAVEAVSEQEPVDLVVPINKTAEFIAHVHRTEAATGMQMVSFGHAGDGNVHLCIVRGARDEETWTRELHEVMTDVYGKAYEMGGLTSGEHGIGIAKRPYYLSATPQVNLDVMRAVKAALDDKHILNDHISYLK